MAVSVLVVYSYIHVADWELLLPSMATGSYHVLLVWEKIKIPKNQVQFLLNVYPFHISVKSKNHCLTF